MHSRPVFPPRLTLSGPILSAYEMAFSTDTERKLLAMSGGRCAKPDCRANLFPPEGDVIVTVAEMAHIIGHSQKGPRGQSNLTESERDTYENAVLLCPNCHDRIDKKKLRASMTMTFCEDGRLTESARSKRQPALRVIRHATRRFTRSGSY